MKEREVGRNLESRGGVPTGLVHNDDGVGAGSDGTTDFLQMHLHGFGIGARQNQSGAFVAGRADGAEEVGPSGALVMRLAWPRTPLGPLVDETIFLPDARFVVEPDLHRRARRQLLAKFAHPSGKVF